MGMIFAPASFVRRAPEHHQLVRLREWQRLREHGIDHAEDRTVCANPERKGENGEDTEAGGFQQHSKGVAKVGYEIADF
jgi:hypothetical protein